MNTNLIKLINGWNPVQIYPLLEDEYFPEIEKISSFINQPASLSTEALARFIDAVFLEAFGEKAYISNREVCIEIADDILKLYRI